MEQDRILIAEDDGDINALLAKILTKEGYRVTQAYSGTEASLRVSQERYDLLLLDLMLPGNSSRSCGRPRPCRSS